jgi:gamma-glutamylcyclotransferase (GGCT)/AIG2-like uncharacterized protein YtfP
VKPPDAVFVYGTLRPGGRFWNQVLASRAVVVSPPQRLMGLALLAGPGFPLAVRCEPSADGSPPASAPAEVTAVHPCTGIVGECVTVSDADLAGVLSDLDQVEGVPDLFERVRVAGLWMYLATNATIASHRGQPVTTGDWLDWDRDARCAWEHDRGHPYPQPGEVASRSADSCGVGPGGEQRPAGD